MNLRGEVIGINSQKLVKKNVSGIGFALSASDLLDVLHRFYPAPVRQDESAAAAAAVAHGPRLPAGAALMDTASPAIAVSGFGITEITSDPDGAEIFLDDKFVGSSPATLHIPAALTGCC